MWTQTLLLTLLAAATAFIIIGELRNRRSMDFEFGMTFYLVGVVLLSMFITGEAVFLAG
jgi:Tfp pilus assembly ATPase PilU